MRGKRKQQIFIWGYNGWKNVGDDAMIYGLLQELHTSNANAEFATLTLAPIVIPSEVESKTSFVKLAPLAVFGEIRKSSIFIIGGGTWIHDYGKRVRNMNNSLRLFILVLLAKVFGNKVYLIGHGLGPITTVWGKTLAKLIYQLADYISVRDKTSYEILKAWGFTDKVSLAFDLSVLIKPCREATNNALENDKTILGISVTPVFEIYYNSREKDLLLINKIAEQINDQLKRAPQLQVYLFTFKGRSKDDDVLITSLLQELLEPTERVNLVPYDPDPRKMLAQVAQCHAFIGMRYHACLFAYLNRVPVMVIDYHPKCRALAEDIGLPPNAVISLEDIFANQFGLYLRNLLQFPGGFLAALPIDVARQRAKMGLLHTG